jgi:acyl transferase domain-containing protein
MASVSFFDPSTAIYRKSAGIGSMSGRCATFSANADGFLPSEGVAAIVIQRKRDVKGPGLARIRASAVNQDGRSMGFAAPNPAAQARLLEMGLKRAGCTPDDISYFESTCW